MKYKNQKDHRKELTGSKAVDGQTKTCVKCGFPKLLNEFNKQKNGKFGVRSICIICQKIYDKIYSKNNKDKKKIYRQNNKEEIKTKMKRYYQVNKEKIKIREKIYREFNKNKIKNKNRIYHLANKNKINLKSNIWYGKNKDKLQIKHAAYRKNNKEKTRKQQRIYIKQRIKTDFKFRLNSNLSSAIAHSLKGNKNGKHWEMLVGYTLEKLKKHLESLFTKGMNWNNYGEWHLEHKIPIAVFNFTQPEHRDFRRCWALSNLQPLWAKENISKGAKLNEHFQPSLLM